MEETGAAVTSLLQPLVEMGGGIVLKILGAILLYVVGRVAIGLIRKIIGRSMKRSSVDETLVRYADSAAVVLLNILLVVAILSVFGVETTTFAGLLAAAGVAIGMAWSGLLANFAAGAFMVFLRPFKVGDFVEAGSVTGTVEEIGLFVTTINSPDNVRTIVGNNAVFSGTIKNYSANPVRRVDLVAQLAHDVDPQQAIELLRGALSQIPNVSSEQAPDVHILEFNLSGPVLCVRPYTHTDHYWQVYFDTNALIKQAFGEAGYSVPEQHLRVLQGPQAR